LTVDLILPCFLTFCLSEKDRLTLLTLFFFAWLPLPFPISGVAYGGACSILLFLFTPFFPDLRVLIAVFDMQTRQLFYFRIPRRRNVAVFFKALSARRARSTFLLAIQLCFPLFSSFPLNSVGGFSFAVVPSLPSAFFFFLWRTNFRGALSFFGRAQLQACSFVLFQSIYPQPVRLFGAFFSPIFQTPRAPSGLHTASLWEPEGT